MTPKKLQAMSQIGKDLVKIKFNKEKTLGALQKEFYQVMRKHGVKWGHRAGNGIQGANFEWSLCQTFFIDRVVSFFNLEVMLNMPEAFNAYEPPPKKDTSGHVHNFRNIKEVCSCGMSKTYHDHFIIGRVPARFGSTRLPSRQSRASGAP